MPGPVHVSLDHGNKKPGLNFTAMNMGKCKWNVPPTHQFVLVQWRETNFDHEWLYNHNQIESNVRWAI